MKKKIVLIGGGGHCKSVIDVIEQQNEFEIAGIVDVEAKLGTEVLGYKVFATDNELDKLMGTYTHYHLSLGFIKPSVIRANLFKKLKELGAQLPIIISPKSTVSKHAKIAEGSIIMHHAFVNAGAVIGANAIINTGAIIEHDAIIGSNCHISTAAVINGDCAVSENCFVGSNSVLVNGIKIGPNTIVGAGAVVHKNVDAGFCTVVGNPAIVIKK